MSVYIIAEAGVNHNGSLDLAKKLVDVAKESGANCVKFQTFKAANLVSKVAKKAEYQKKTTQKDESQLDMLKKLELSYEEFVELFQYCKLKEIDFMSTAFDMESIDFLDELGMDKWKIPSGDITNLPYLIKIAQLGKPIILSTGMSTMTEVKEAVEAIQKHNNNEITILHCTTEYPTIAEDVNLKAMLTLKEEFRLPVGYSDHTQGILVPVAATALGASIIEKHFTLSREMEGPDHQASLEPHELRKMVNSINQVKIAMGDGVKKPVHSEFKNIEAARKSIIAKRRITKGELFSEDNLSVKRPGNGISPMHWFDVLGKVATKDFDEDELIIL